MRIEGATHTGKVRQRNEDDYGWDEAAGVAMVADGLGGHPAGDQASQLVVATVLEAARGVDAGTWLGSGGDPVALLGRCHERLLEHGRRHPADLGLGTTAVLAAWDGPRLVVAHCGDSRAYRLRAGSLAALTADHNAAREAVDRGQLTAEQARRSPARHQLTEALGVGDEAPRVDVTEMAVSSGDVILLCTDGLHGELDDDAIGAAIAGAGDDLRSAADGLVHAALMAGGSDNVTVVLLGA